MIEGIIDPQAPEFIEAVRRQSIKHLEDSHATLWGRTWNLFDGVERFEAADWLATTMIEVLVALSEDDLS